jgi:polyhydroxyalkanoate synthesis regulator phasin
MKRKLISKMLVLTFTIVGIGMFSSCKDYEEDMYSELQGNQNTLESTLQKQIDALKSQLATMNSTKADLDAVKDSLASYLKKSDFGSKFDESFAIAMANYTCGSTKLDSAIASINNNLANVTNQLNDIKSQQSLYAKNQAKSDSVIAVLVGLTNTLNKTAADASAQANAAYALATKDSVAAAAAMSKAVAALDASDANSAQITEMKQSISNLNNSLGDLKGTVTSLNNTIVGWGDSLRTAYSNAASAKALADGNAAWIDAFKNVYQTKIDSINTVTADLQTSINEVRDLANSNYEKANQYTDTAIKDVKDLLTKQISDANDAINATNIKLGDLKTAYETEDKVLQGEIDQLNKDVATVNAKLTTLTNAINARFTNVLTKLVTGIIVQGTENPVFGSIALPLDIRSNVLIAYYGTNITPGTRDFPYYKSTYEADYESGNSFSSADIDFLKNNCNTVVQSVKNGATLMDDSIGNAGTIYLTINPTSTDFSNLPVTLVNSQDVASGITLGALKKSDKTLTFGYTRSSSNNGFYEAPATLSADKINDVKINIQSGLTSAMKDALTALKNKSTNIDITGLASSIYNQFNGVLDAEGVKTTWTDSLGERSVVSQYNIAATAIHPLSFKFLEGTSLLKLPTISPLSEINLNLDSVNFNFNPTFTIKGNAAHITLSHVNFSADEINVIINVPDVNSAVVDPVTNKVTWTMIADTVKLDDLKDFVSNLNTELNGQIDDWDTNINQELQKQVDDLVSQINTEVSSKLSEISGQLNQSVNDVLKEISNQVAGKFSSYIGKLNNYITQINSFTSKINKYLSDPNHYLQVCLLYQGADGAYHQLSNSKVYPTEFNVSGGTATSFLPTSYTAEIAAPAYEKFVAVTNVYKGNASAQGGDAACLAALKAANNLKFMNEVIPGKRLTVPFEATLTDCVYEITYSALDYNGYSSTRKFYVKVVK